LSWSSSVSTLTGLWGWTTGIQLLAGAAVPAHVHQAFYPGA